MTDKLREAAQQALEALEQYQLAEAEANGAIRVCCSTRPSEEHAQHCVAAEAVMALRAALAQQDAQTNHCPTCKRTDGDMCDWCPSMQQDAQAVPPQQDLKILMNRLENQAHRAGELWERCQGKSWPEKESAEFAALRDVKMPQTRAALAAMLNATPTPPAQQEWIDDAGRLQWALWRIKDLEQQLAGRPVAITPPAQRVMLTPEEITEVIVDCYGYSADIEFHECLARAVIEAYERKNAQPNAETVAAMQEARQIHRAGNRG